MQWAKPKLCQYEIVKPWALLRHLFAPPPLSETICCWVNAESSRLTDVCPAITLEKMFLFWPVVYFGGAGVVSAVQKGKRCGGSCWTWWKVIQYTDAAITWATQQPHIVKERGGNQSNKFSLFLTQNLRSCMLYSRACLACLTLIWDFVIVVVVVCPHSWDRAHEGRNTSPA